MYHNIFQGFETRWFYQAHRREVVLANILECQYLDIVQQYVP